MKISLCTDMFYWGEPTHKLLPKLAEAGCEAFEFWGYEGKDLAAIAAAMDATGMKLAGFLKKHNNLVDAGERGNYIAGLEESLTVAERLNCKTVITTVGQRIDGVSEEAQLESIVEGLKQAAPLTEAAGVTLVLEPLNQLNHPGYFLSRSDIAFQIINEVNSPSVKLLYDIYHQQITEGNLIATITANIKSIGHFHVADVPGRHDPGSGEINYINVVSKIAEAGYGGYIGLEYAPLCEQIESFRRVVKFLA
jgi:hydroxypyruvate isomerase